MKTTKIRPKAKETNPITISDINSYVSFRGNTNTTEYTAANRLISTNRWYHIVTDMIFDSIKDYQHDDLNVSTETIISKNTVLNQGYVALGLTDEILNVKRVEVSYDGTNYYKAEPFQAGMVDTSLASQTLINDHFSTTKPFYEHRGQLVYLYPVPTSSVTNGLKLWVDREAAEYSSSEVTTGTKEPGFAEPFHIMVGLGMVYDWFTAKNQPAKALEIKAELNEYETRLRKHYGRKNSDAPMRLSAAFNDYE